MSKSINKHLSLDNRNDILKYIKEGYSLRKIASIINCSPSTVSRELKKHRIIKSPNIFNNSSYKNNPCKSNRLTGFPWVCNGCVNFKHCRKEKYIYDPTIAHNDYKSKLTDIRNGPHCNPNSFEYLNYILTPAIKDKGQTVSHVFSYLYNEIAVSRSTLYRYIDKGYLEVKNIDLPRKVRYKPRKNNNDYKSPVKAKAFTKGRTYLDFQAYIHHHKNASIYEMDTVEGKKGDGEKVLLTILLRKSNFMLAFLRDSNDPKNVVDIFNKLEKKLTKAAFSNLFNVGLTDRGKEFSKPDLLEDNSSRICRTHLFYCDPRQSQQKGKIEKNHEYIRYFFPQGTSFNNLTQAMLDEMMNHINSVKRDYLASKSPFECLSKYQLKQLKKLGYKEISPSEVTLNSSLFKK